MILGLIIGMFIGGFLGVALMCLMNIGRNQ